jgi:hypothetical protein
VYRVAQQPRRPLAAVCEREAGARRAEEQHKGDEQHREADEEAKAKRAQSAQLLVLLARVGARGGQAGGAGGEDARALHVRRAKQRRLDTQEQLVQYGWRALSDGVRRRASKDSRQEKKSLTHAMIRQEGAAG